MKKAVGIGVIIAVIIGVIVVSAGISMDSVEDTGSISEEVELEETIALEEVEEEAPEEVELEETITIEEEEPIVVEEEPEGRDLSVELRESIGLKGP